MTLPILKYPVIELTILSTGQKLKARPFLAQEEKLLLMASQTRDSNEMIDTVVSVIEACLEDKNVSIRKLPFFDVYNFFTTLRAKSISEKTTVTYTCKNILEDNSTCESKFKVDLDVLHTKLEVNQKISNIVQLSDSVVVKLKYPAYNVLKREVENESEPDRKERVLYGCLESISDRDQVYTPKDFSLEEWKEWCGKLTMAQRNILEVWIENLPILYVEEKAKCPKCGFEHSIRHKDMQDFFL